MNFAIRDAHFAFTIGMLAGLAVGLSMAWIIYPPPLLNAEWSQLRHPHKRDLLALIAAAYAVDQDLPSAEARLRRLGLPNLRSHLAEAAREGPASAQLVAALFPEMAPAPTLASTPTRAEAMPTQSPFLRSSPTTVEQPTLTPREASYRLVEVLDLGCNADHPQDALLIYVRSGEGRGIPWVAIRLQGPLGEDLFYTGLRPHIDPGYADYLVSAYGNYEVGLAEGELGAPALLRFEACLSQGEEQHRLWRMVFEREFE